MKKNRKETFIYKDISAGILPDGFAIYLLIYY
jgi:hypothetical protein